MAVCTALVAMQSIHALANDDYSPPLWQAIKDKDLRITQGSILDFSDIFTAMPKHADTPIGVSQQGHLVLMNENKERIRFFCATLVPGGPHGGFPKHDQADELALQLRLHGYNLVRFHFVDEALIENPAGALKFEAEALDRFYYLLSALKQQGIYWMIDAATSQDGIYGNKGKSKSSTDAANLRLDVHIDSSAKDYWKKMVINMLGNKNPYTGQSALSDPALAIITLVNESGLDHVTRKGYSDQLLEPFRTWLLKKYGDITQINKAWDDADINYISDIQLPKKDEVSKRVTDLLQFFTDLERSTLEWATQFLREEGYQGLITNYNNGRSVRSRAIGRDLTLITQHGYYDHPSDFSRPGSTIKGGSSIADSLPYVRDFASSRFGGKPFIVDEYDHPFWNPYRREAGLAVPAIAALQNWDGIARFTNPVKLSYDNPKAPRDKAIYPFGIGIDPISRAGETLAALLYRRIDVRPAQSNVAIDLTAKEVYSEGLGKWRPMPDDLSRMGLVTGLGLRWEEADDSAKKNSNWSPELSMDYSLTELKASNKITKAVKKLGRRSEAGWPERIAALKKANILPSNNRTDPSAGIYESDTGEILIETNKRRMTVVTPNTEAIVFDGGLPVTLSQLMIQSSTSPALVSISSLDDHPLSDSTRMLIILATDALNSNMRLSKDRTTLYELGELPILMRTTQVTLTFYHNSPESLDLYSTMLNGKRMDKISIDQVPGGVRFTLDTSQLSHGPTTYFELVHDAKRPQNKTERDE